jgi:hypothetical protein
VAITPYSLLPLIFFFFFFFFFKPSNSVGNIAKYKLQRDPPSIRPVIVVMLLTVYITCSIYPRLGGNGSKSELSMEAPKTMHTNDAHEDGNGGLAVVSTLPQSIHIKWLTLRHQPQSPKSPAQRNHSEKARTYLK